MAVQRPAATRRFAVAYPRRQNVGERAFALFFSISESKASRSEHRAQRSEHGAQLVAVVNCRAYEFRIKPFVLQAKMSSTYSVQHGFFRQTKSWREKNYYVIMHFSSSSLRTLVAWQLTSRGCLTFFV